MNASMLDDESEIPMRSVLQLVSRNIANLQRKRQENQMAFMLRIKAVIALGSRCKGLPPQKIGGRLHWCSRMSNPTCIDAYLSESDNMRRDQWVRTQANFV